MNGTASAAAGWRHVAAREGFEVVFVHPTDAGGRRLEGRVCAVEDGRAWAVRFRIVVDGAWRTRSASIRMSTGHGCRGVTVDGDGDGHWRVDGEPAPALDGCLDVDLEASAATNAFPVARLGLAIGVAADAPAAYVRLHDLAVERLEQRYARIGDDGDRRRFRYAAPSFAFEAILAYDASGLIVDYPGIAVRVL